MKYTASLLIVSCLYFFTPVRAEAALQDNLQGCWDFNESSGTASDATSNNNDLTNNNTVAFAAAKIDNGADFEDGSTEWFSIADGSQTGLDITGDLSISIWYKPESIQVAGNYESLVAKFGSDDNTRAYRLLVSSDVMLLQVSSDGVGVTNGVWASMGLSDANWYHFVMVYDASAGTADLWVNGSAKTQATGLSTSIANTGAPFNIGRSEAPAEYYLDGIADIAAIWNKTLDSTEVSTLYNGGTGIDCTDILNGGAAPAASFNPYQFWDF